MAKKISRNKTDEVHDEIMSAGVEPESTVEFISSGSTVLNLALSQRGAGGGWARARVINIVGDTSSGKTLLAIEAAHWAYRNLPKIKSNLFPPVEKVEIDFGNSEGVMDFPIGEMYGEDFYEALMKDSELSNNTAESAGRYCMKRIAGHEPGTAVIHIIDTWDALSSEDDEAKFEESIKKDKPIDGTYAMGKPAFASKFFFKSLADKLRFNRKDFTIFVISQTREAIGVTFGFNKRRSGGAALDFYSHQVCWLHQANSVSKPVTGGNLLVSLDAIAKVRKNKVARPMEEGRANILIGYGVDDVMTMSNWLFPKGPFSLPSMSKAYQQREPFIQYVLSNNLEQELQAECEARWIADREKHTLVRKPKF
jgi:RecA/RadA recombinase